jgi:pilus assembly protein CpaE
MSMTVPDPKRGGWHAESGEAPVRMVLSRQEQIFGDWAAASAAGFPIEVAIAALAAPLEPDLFHGAAAAVVEVAESSPASIERFAALAKGDVPLIAAAADPSLGFVRALVRSGAHDVVPLPIELSELESALEPIRRQRASEKTRQRTGDSRLVAIIKSEGGVGATALLGQLATRFAAAEAPRGREACLIDFDLQFGDAAFQLGLEPQLTLGDLIAAGSRLDGDLLRSTMTPHPSGLQVVAAPREILPLDSLDSDHLMALIGLARAEFSTVFVDLPANWTNWSLSLLARADLVLMVTHLGVSSLNRARRQLDLLASQGFANVQLRLVLNRFEKKMFDRLSARDVERVLGRPADFTVANDYQTITEAIERGVPLAEVRRKGALARDLALLETGVAQILKRER